MGRANIADEIRELRRRARYDVGYGYSRALTDAVALVESYERDILREVDLLDEICRLTEDISRSKTIESVLAAEVDRLRALLDEAREAMACLLDAITARDSRDDRSLTITGATASLKYLLDAEDNARAALTKIGGQ